MRQRVLGMAWLPVILALASCEATGESPPVLAGDSGAAVAEGSARPSLEASAQGGGNTDAVVEAADHEATTGTASDATTKDAAAKETMEAAAKGSLDGAAAESAAESGGVMGSGDVGARDAVGAPAVDSSLDSGLSSAELAWVGPMNAARALVGEAPLGWDPIAAQVALAYAKKCMWQHNPNAAAEYMALGGKSGLGEDIAAGAPTQTIEGAVTGWIAERADYDHATNSCASGKVCGHYTQIVWSTTTAVGCAQVSCTTNSPFGSFANGLWDFEVCDFSPPGNIGSLSPY